MDQIYLGYTGWQYLFMVTWMISSIGLVWAYVRVQDLKEQLEYLQYLNQRTRGRQ